MKQERFRIDLEKLTPFEQFVATHEQDRAELYERLAEASAELNFYNWCDRIESVHVGLFYPGIVSVFLMSIETRFEDVDKAMWVIVGDLPPAYITCDNAPNAACALDAYIGAMKEWAEAAVQGDSVAQLIPVNVPATPEMAERLMRRLIVLEESILCNFKDDLKQ